MPRASWKGFLRLSLVSCPVFLSPATTRTKAIRLHQVWVPSAEIRRDEPAYQQGPFEPAANELDEEEMAAAANHLTFAEPVNLERRRVVGEAGRGWLAIYGSASGGSGA